MLERAKALMNDRPDSALTILDSLGQHEPSFGRRFRMQYRLHRLNALNKADTLFRSTAEAQALVDYFDGSGSPNEQMLAYYLLGRAYFDTHEAPMALSCYHTAAERADTTAQDCDYAQLSRVYGQMAKIFYQQNLMRQSLDCENLSVKYGWLGNDTLNVIRSIVGKIAPFKDLSEVDSALRACEYASALSTKIGCKEMSAAILGSVIRNLVDQGQIEKAKNYIDRYEQESGYFDSTNNIERGRESYYYTKGYYYLAVGKLDSAECLFRKELRDGEDFNNQNGGSRGLALLFQKKHMPDSAAKYALYSYAMNDSVYAQMATDEVEQIQGLYDYSRNQEIAQREKKRADAEKEKVYWLISLLAILGLLATFFILKEKAKRAEALQKYKANVSALALAQVEMNQLRSQKMESTRLAQNKEKQVTLLQGEVRQYQANEQRRIESEEARLQAAENKLNNSPLYAKLQTISNRGEKIADDDWQWIYSLAIECFPDFWEFVSAKKFALNESEFNTCVLIRLHVRPVSASAMLDFSTGYMAKLRTRLFEKLFGESGTSKQFDDRIMKYA